tara:strand:+ start:2862 stop:3368 length:507 start_codon:yes stop_codon:yes gene_type:complete
MIKVNIEKNLKDWQILEDNEVIIRAKRPKWYSSEISFFFNGKTYQLKKNSFWKSTIDIFQGGQTIGSITHSYPTGYKVNINNSKKIYSLSKVNKGGMWRVEREYTFNELGPKPMFKINYSKKNFGNETIEIDKVDLDSSNYDLIMYGLKLMRLTQASEAAAASPTFYG